MSVFETYRKQLCKKKEKNYLFSQWGDVILKNCDRRGLLLVCNSSFKFKKQNRGLWINLPLWLFRDPSSGKIFPVWLCEECTKMKGRVVHSHWSRYVEILCSYWLNLTIKIKLKTRGALGALSCVFMAGERELESATL